MAIALLAAVMVVASLLISTQLSRSGSESGLTGAPGDCEAIDISGYNAVITDMFTGVLLDPFHDADDAHYADDGGWWCTTAPDPQRYCPVDSCDSAEYSGLTYNRLWIEVTTDCSDICGLTEREREEIQNTKREKYEGWEWVIRGYIFHTEEAPWLDYRPVRGSIISIYEYENLQILIKLHVIYDAPAGSSDERMEAFTAVNRETAEAIRDRVIGRQ